jgi:SAM-dependent MidA family methyltransferase
VSDVLARRLRDEIRDGGPITFARFMEVALTDPEHGYYMQTAARPTRDGDFLTAPELHPIFGRTVARQVNDCWRLLGRPETFTLREYGAGSGALIETILDGLRADGSGMLAADVGDTPGGAGRVASRDPADVIGRVPLRVEPVEVNPDRRRELAARVAATAPGVQVADPVPGAPLVGLVLANEFVDALPVHRVVARGGRFREILVGWEEAAGAEAVAAAPRDGAPVGPGPDAAPPDEAAALGGRFVDVLADPTTPAIAERLAAEGVELADGQVAEVRLADGPWLDEIARDLRRGHVLVIDYGAPAAELYDPARRPAGTLLAYRGHQVHDDLYADPGDQDLTAHVDLTALEDCARRRGLVPIGRMTQTRFLVACGLGDLFDAIRSDPATTFEAYLAARSAVARLLDPRATGGFAVLALGRDLPPGAELLRGLGGPASEGRPALSPGLAGPASGGSPTPPEAVLP